MSAAEQAFVELFKRWYREQFAGRDDVQITMRTNLQNDLELDDTAQAEFPEFLQREMGRSVGVGSEVMFHQVYCVSDLYEKLSMSVDGFTSWMGEDEDDEGASSAQPSLASTLPKSALAKLIDADEAAGEEELEAQLRLVKPVQVAARTHVPGQCIECEDRQAILTCEQCDDEFCGVCFSALHRKGRRAQHATHSKPGFPTFRRESEQVSSAAAVENDEGEIEMPLDLLAEDVPNERDFVTRAQFIPLRLQQGERRRLRLLEAQLAVSTYTDAIDRPSLPPNKRVHAQILKVCAFLSGLAVSVDYEVGREAVSSRKWKEYEGFFRSCLELGRRHKILNPDRMRTEYGRLMYMMMDAKKNDVQQLLGFDVQAPIVTVYSYLKANGAHALLSDPRMEIATRAIDQMDQLAEEARKKSRQEVRREVKEKEAAVKALARQYRNAQLSEDDIKWALYSIGDNRSFLLQHRDPVTRMISYLTRFFGPGATDPDGPYSLAIYSGSAEGARLTHSHERQYNYVLQSLTLWREIINDMFRLWCLAEEDMLDPACPYELQDTGQGHQRVQAAPRVAKAMRDLLFRTQSQLGSWVGSSVVHLGDKNVPNALQFLDKYTQVSRILSPIALCLDRLPEMCLNDKTNAYIEEVFGGIETCRKDMLHDFFRNAFDGSGADNFFDAGSCIDGRLTSTWNWCNQITQKKFYSVLKLSGWSTFDGEFQD